MVATIMNKNTNQHISLVLPCYNPPIGWEKVVVNSVQSIEKKDVKLNLIVVIDGAKINVTPTQLAYLKEKVDKIEIIDYPINRGKGFALRSGVEKVKTDLVIYTDIDFPYTEESFFAIYDGLLEGNDVVVGHRGQSYYEKTPYVRKVISKSLRWTLKTFLRLPTDDSQCGIKGFNKTGATIFLDTEIDRFLFDLEFIKLASKRKVKIQKKNVTLKPDVVFSKVNFSILFSESINFFKVLFRK